MEGKPEIYEKFYPNEAIKFATLSLDEYFQKMTWSDNDIILDIGCGTGNKTKYLLLDKCPKVKKIVGIDIDARYIDYAKKNYSDEKISYMVQDITIRNGLEDTEKYDKVFSFYVFHYVTDLEKMLSNISAVMKPGAYFLFLVCTRSQMFSHGEIVNTCEDWRKSLKAEDLISALPETANWINVEDNFKTLLSKFGLLIQDSKYDVKDAVYLKENNLYHCYLATCPKSLLKNLDDGFKSNLWEKTTSLFQIPWVKKENGNFAVSYEVFTFFGQKKM